MRVALPALVLLAACAEVDSPSPEMVLPSDYRTAFVQVQNCGNSVDHNFMDVVVRVRSGDVDRYRSGPYPFPKGSLVVKEEYRGQGCTDLSGYTVMRKEDSGYFPAGGDWQWFTLDSGGTVLKNGKVPACSNCHATSTSCGPAHDLTCPGP
jgi:hypothetical protein